MQNAHTDAEGRINNDDTRRYIKRVFLDQESLTPGVYTFEKSVSITNNIQFNGLDEYIFIPQIKKQASDAARGHKNDLGEHG
jgi:hypothetical protein